MFSLPRVNFLVLKRIFKFLLIIASEDEYKICKMSSKNLSIVFMATINLTSSSEGYYVLILAENSNSLMESVKLMIDYADYIFEEEIKEEFLKFSSSPFEEFMVQRLNSIESQLKEIKQQIHQDTLHLESVESKLDKLSSSFESFSTNESKEIQRIKKNLFDQNVKVEGGFGFTVKKKEPSPVIVSSQEGEGTKKVPSKYVYNHRGEIMNKIPFQ
jgi:hypothetical protein